MEDLHHQRRIYERDSLLESEADPNPMQQFRRWYLEAEEHDQVLESNAMSVSTVEADGCPRTRMVLLKSYDWDGFVFYTNYDSRKGRALEASPQACLHFFWPALERQVVIKAKVSKISPETSDAYFQSRPKGSQLGAIVSPQSRVIPNRQFLEKNLQQLEEEYADAWPARPENWGGYLAAPFEIEFWQGRPNRLHDRLLYTLENGLDWKMCRLAP